MQWFMVEFKFNAFITTVTYTLHNDKGTLYTYNTGNTAEWYLIICYCCKFLTKWRDGNVICNNNISIIIKSSLE